MTPTSARRTRTATPCSTAAFGIDIRNADGLIVISDMSTGFWTFKMEGFSGWNGEDWGMPDISSAQKWDDGTGQAAGELSGRRDMHKGQRRSQQTARLVPCAGFVRVCDGVGTGRGDRSRLAGGTLSRLPSAALAGAVPNTTSSRWCRRGACPVRELQAALAKLRSPLPPYGVALGGDGSYVYDFTVRFERLRPPRDGAYVVWTTDSRSAASRFGGRVV